MPGSLNCFIWGTPASESRDTDGQNIYVFSHRAGGLYSVATPAIQPLGRLTTKQKLLLTTWLCDQRSAGVHDPLITTDTLEEIKQRQPLPISQRFNRALLHFNNLGLTDTVTLLENENPFQPNVVTLAAVSECEDIKDLLALTSLMQNMNLLRDMTPVAGRHELTPTAKGWLRIEELTTTPMNLPQGFVAMWLNETTQEAFEKGIDPAIANCGWKPLRIDKKEHANKVDDEIIAEIRRSRFVVADFTCGEDGVRGSVYYEAGFANGLRIPVIWTCHKDSLKRLHFDTRQYSHVVWKSPGELRKKLQARIGAVIGDGPLPKPR